MILFISSLPQLSLPKQQILCRPAAACFDSGRAVRVHVLLLLFPVIFDCWIKWDIPFKKLQNGLYLINTSRWGMVCLLKNNYAFHKMASPGFIVRKMTAPGRVAAKWKQQKPIFISCQGCLNPSVKDTQDELFASMSLYRQLTMDLTCKPLLLYQCRKIYLLTTVFFKSNNTPKRIPYVKLKGLFL